MIDGRGYRCVFEMAGLLDKVAVWLTRNPPPKEWQWSKWAYAWTERPFLNPWDNARVDRALTAYMEGARTRDEFLELGS